MNNMQGFGQKLNKSVTAFSRNPIVRTISSGMARILPVTIIASFVMIFMGLPFEGYQAFLKSSGIGNILNVGATMTNSIISIYIVIALSSEMAKIYKKEQLNAIFIALIGFFILTPLTGFDVNGKTVMAFTLTNFGSRGIFVAMLVSLVSTRTYIYLNDKGVKIRMPKEVPPAISNGFESMLIAVIISVGFLVLNALISQTQFGDIHTMIYSFLQKPLEGMGSSLWAMLVIAMIGEGFWWFGIHGSNVTSAVISAIYLPLALANAESVIAGLAPEFILNSYFLEVYKGPRHMALALMLLLLAKSKHLKSIGKVAVVPGVFGISEPMKFGIPMIFNPAILVPMTLAPVISIVIAYFATIVGFIQPVSLSVPWIMPAFISGFMASGFRGVIVQAVQFVAIVLLYLPFFKYLDNQKIIEEAEVIESQNA